MKTLRRYRFGELSLRDLNPRTRKQIQNLVEAAAKAQKVDEHGNWDFGIENWGRKNRGYIAMNWDLYGYGRDRHNGRLLCVIQVRQTALEKPGRWAQTRKSYFLLGRNEDDTVFAHPVGAQVVQRAARDGRDVVRAVQDWIFSADYERVIRHGDVALVPLARVPQAELMERTEITIQPEDGSASHLLKAAEIRLNGSLYALNPYLRHTPGTHPDVMGKGWYRVVVGRRADFYDFAAPTID